MEAAAAKISFVVLIAFLVSAQETVAVCLLVDIATAKRRVVTVVSAAEEM